MYRRVLLVARLDGWSVVGVAVFGTLLTLVFGDLVGTLIGLLVVGAGAMELHGQKCLRRRDPSGMKWLVRAQLYLLSVILVYCASRLGSFDSESAMGNLTPEMADALKEAGLEAADILPLVRTAFFATYVTLASVSLLYQGGMALYYSRRTLPVTTYLAQPLPVPGHSPLA